MTAPTPYASGPDFALYRGDCLELMPKLALRPDFILTDPPYGIGWRRGEGFNGAKAGDPIANDHDTTARDAALALFPEVPGAVFGSFYAPFPDRLKQVLVWHKPEDAGVVGSVTGYRRDAEPVFLVGPWPKRPARGTSVLSSARRSIGKLAAETGHPHTKPVDLLARLLAFIPAGSLVLDPFAGSGSSGVAALATAHRFIGFEIDDAYAATAARRLRQASGLDGLFAPAVVGGSSPSGTAPPRRRVLPQDSS